MIIELILFSVVSVFAFITFCVSLYNLLTAPVPGKNLSSPENNDSLPFLSILIPARNEEENIATSVRSCLNQNHLNIEVIVLDDHSEDRTGEIVTGIAAEDDRVKLLRGKPLPKGWLGKNWACHQLSEEAKGEHLLFIDADVILREDATGIALNTLKKYDLSMFSVFPTQLLNSFGSALVIPLMNWLLLNFLPLKQVYKSKSPKFVAANGQFILMTRNAYSVTGGHSAVRDKVVEDMELSRLIKRSGMRMMTALGGEVIRCRMYSGFLSSIRGFTKNFYAGFDIPAVLFVMMITFFVLVYLVPFVFVFFNTIWMVTVLLTLLSRWFISRISNSNPAIEVLCHPIQMIIMYFTGWRSLFFTKTGIIEWKGRTL